ncbi:hypothetical protein B0H34DRAFT_786690 [Crassisporium funariophilum]|nr:hypothetical protein B0H34DRAFT_786690 [Crassisporium funariophilum]
MYYGFGQWSRWPLRGWECYCDSTIQIPGQPAALSDCNFGCNGNASESCGSSGRLNLLYNGKPGPTLVPRVLNVNGDTWAYQGCFIDSINQRTLVAPLCTAACQSLGGYTYAGMEIRHECWCDNAINPPTQRVSDNNCRTVCSADHTQYCGNTNHIVVYRL